MIKYKDDMFFRQEYKFKIDAQAQEWVNELVQNGIEK